MNKAWAKGIGYRRQRRQTQTNNYSKRRMIAVGLRSDTDLSDTIIVLLP